MRDLIIHIGRHKSGTTAIQKFLTRNRERLQQHGIYVPSNGPTGPAHHHLSQPMQEASLRSSGIKDPREIETLEEFQDEISNVDPALRIVITSEAFQNCDPQFVKRAFADFRARIVVYVRNQLDYLATSYTQRVHATNYSGSLQDYFRNIYSVNYFRFLASWSEGFPHDFVVRRYRREDLLQGDVVQDFITHGLDLKDQQGLRFGPDVDPNPSINARVVQFKRHLNQQKLVDERKNHLVYKALPKMNEHFPGKKLRLPENVKNQLVWECYDSDAAAAIRYFGEQELFDYSTYETAEETPLTQPELDAMYAYLEDELQAAGSSLSP